MAEQEGFEPSSRVSGYTISSRARYDHFDTAPYSCIHFYSSFVIINYPLPKVKSFSPSQTFILV